LQAELFAMASAGDVTAVKRLLSDGAPITWKTPLVIDRREAGRYENRYCRSCHPLQAGMNQVT
jgi:hypothetical protein